MACKEKQIKGHQLNIVDLSRQKKILNQIDELGIVDVRFDTPTKDLLDVYELIIKNTIELNEDSDYQKFINS